MQNNSSPKQERLWPTLILGLGGSGSDIVRYAKYSLTREWRRRLPESARTDAIKQELPGIIQFLAVDTVPFEPAPSKDLEARLEPDEYVYMGGFNAARLIANLDQHPLIETWWPATTTTRFGRIHSGARQVRIVGRLAFYRKYRTFWANTANKLQLARIAQIQRAEDAGYTVVRETGLRQIYIVCSACGGTGAGMLLDVAHRLREAEGERAMITGILLMPSVFLGQIQSSVQKSRIMSNAYATLKELEYFLSGNEFTAAYPDEAEMRVTRPFDRVYLVENENKASETLKNLTAVEKMVADFLYVSIMTRVGMTMNERDVNISTEVMRISSNTSQTLSRSFGALAVSRLAVDEERLRNYFSCVELTSFLDEKVLGRAPDADEVGRRAADLDAKLDQVVTRDRPNSDETLGDRQQRDSKLLSVAKVAIEQEMAEHGLQHVKALVQKLRKLASGDEGGKCREHRKQFDDLNKSAQDEEGGWLWSLGSRLPLVGDWIDARRSAQDQERTKSDEEIREVERILLRWQGIASALERFDAEIGRWQESVDRLKKDLERERSRVWNEQNAASPVVAPDDHVSELVTPQYAERFVEAIQNQSELVKLRDRLWKILEDHFYDHDWVVVRELFSKNQGSSDGKLREQELQYRLELKPTIEKDYLFQIIDRESERLLTDRYFGALEKTGGEDIKRVFTQFLARCQPFCVCSFDQSQGFTEGSLEPVRVVGVPYLPNDDLLKQLLGDKWKDYDQVSTGDSSQIIGVNIEHGISPYYLEHITTYYEQYKVYRGYDEPVHLDKRWQDKLKQLALSKAEASELAGSGSA